MSHHQYNTTEGQQIGSIPNLNGSHHHNNRGGFNFPHSFHHHQQQNGSNSNNNGNGPGRSDLARTIDRIRYQASTVSSNNNNNALNSNTPTSNTNGSSHPHHPGRNFVLQLGTPGATTLQHLPGNPPPYSCSSESSHDVTPDSGIVSDIHSKSRMEIPEVVYAR